MAFKYDDEDDKDNELFKLLCLLFIISCLNYIHWCYK